MMKGSFLFRMDYALLIFLQVIYQGEECQDEYNVEDNLQISEYFLSPSACSALAFALPYLVSCDCDDAALLQCVEDFVVLMV